MKPAWGRHAVAYGEAASCARFSGNPEQGRIINMKANTDARGFTLLEVMVVLAILAILAALALPIYMNYITRSRIRIAQSDLLALSASIENHRQRTLLYPAGTLNGTAAVSGRFATWTPASRPADFSFTYTTDPSGYRITATGLSTRLAGCTASLTAANARTTAGCPSVGDLSW